MAVQQISHYEIESTLGEGGMGRVYRARDIVLDRHVALKVLAGVSLSDPSFLERFHREARLAAQLNHPHIARIYEFGEHDGQPFLVMELVEGRTLSDMIRNGPLTVDEVRRIGRQMASALGAAHGKGIVHRDIKPGNVMITPEGNVEVMDFGVARREGEAQLTTDGSLMGTPNTMAPETINGQDPGPPADLFAMGCVLYEALTGTPPFKGADPLTVLFQVLHGEPPKISELRTDVPPELSAVIDALLVKDPAARFGPARAVEKALGGAVTGDYAAPAPTTGTIVVTPGTARAGTTGAAPLPGPTLPMELPAAEPSATTRRGFRRAAIGAGAAVAIMAGVFLVFRGPFGAPPEKRRAEAVRLNDDLGAVLADKLYRQGLEAAAPESLAQARRYFEQAARRDPSFPNPWNNLGNLSLFEGKLEDAEKDFRKAVNIDPDYAVARVGWADALDRLGRKADAELQYRHALNNDTTLVAAPNNLAYLLISADRSAEAVDVLMPALMKWPQISLLWKNYGLARLKMGDAGEAERAFNNALRLEPGNAPAMAGLARIAESRGDRDAAMAIWEKLVAVPDTALAREARQKLQGS